MSLDCIENETNLFGLLQELKRQVFLGEEGKRKGIMKVRNLEVEFETVTESSEGGGVSFSVVHGEKEKLTQTRNRIKINLVSPDIIQMERDRFGLERDKFGLEIASLIKPYLIVTKQRL